MIDSDQSCFAATLTQITHKYHSTRGRGPQAHRVLSPSDAQLALRSGCVEQQQTAEIVRCIEMLHKHSQTDPQPRQSANVAPMARRSNPSVSLLNLALGVPRQEGRRKCARTHALARSSGLRRVVFVSEPGLLGSIERVLRPGISVQWTALRVHAPLRACGWPPIPSRKAANPTNRKSK